METKLNLLEGKIFPTIVKLAMPIVMTMMMQMAYNMIDMIWIGHLGATAVAAVGVAGMFGWLSSGLSLICRIGGQVKIGHSFGEKNMDKVHTYTSATYQIGIILAVSYGMVILLFSRNFIGLFGLNEVQTIQQANMYLKITCGLIIFSFLNQITTAIFNVSGDSKTPFLCNASGLFINLFLDPMLIFGVGIFPELGVQGAAIATVWAQFMVFCLYLLILKKKKHFILESNLFQIYNKNYYQNIIKIGLPVALQNMMFSICSMIIASIVAGYGDYAVATQKVGTQIEALGWNIADGFEATINSFIAQNYGAKYYDRVKKGYQAMMSIVFIWGSICTVALLFFAKPLFMIFLRDPRVIPLDIDYLHIFGYSQLFMVAEITIAGAFSGLGHPKPASIISITFTLGRLPLIMLLTQYLGLNGIWWAMSISSMVKGVLLFVWFEIYKRKVLV